MNQNLLFQNTKLRLTCYYAGVMGVILSICGLGVYEAIAHAHWSTLDREIESVAGSLHDSLETVLQQPGQLEPDVLRIIPDLCFLKSEKSDPIQLNLVHYPLNKSNKNFPLISPNSELNCLPIIDKNGQEFHRLAPINFSDWFTLGFNYSWVCELEISRNCYATDLFFLSTNSTIYRRCCSRIENAFSCYSGYRRIQD